MAWLHTTVLSSGFHSEAAAVLSVPERSQAAGTPVGLRPHQEVLESYKKVGWGWPLVGSGQELSAGYSRMERAAAKLPASIQWDLGRCWEEFEEYLVDLYKRED